LCGTPVIITEECGEVIKEANLGHLVKYGDIACLKDKIKSVMENQREDKEIVEKGRKYIMENFAWNNIVKLFEDVYDNCIHPSDTRIHPSDTRIHPSDIFDTDSR